jgi:predicted aspartyl protease
MKTRTNSEASLAREVRARTTLQLRVRIVTSLLALLTSVPSCHALPSPGETDHIEEQAKTNPEIPFRLCNDNLIVVKGSIGQIRDVNFILDTGTSPTIIAKTIAAHLKLRGQTGLLVTLNGTTHGESLILPHLQIGPLQADSAKVVVNDLRSLEQTLGISLGGIVGLDILGTANFSIDYQRKKIVFGGEASMERAVPLATSSPYLLVKAEVEGQQLRLLLDSGTPGLLVYRNRIDAKNDKLQMDPNRSLFTAGGMNQVRWLHAEVKLGEHHLNAVDVAIADVDSEPGNDFDGLLGFVKMGFHKVTFDFQKGLFGWE